jgi:Flp pilus assembly protein TadD
VQINPNSRTLRDGLGKELAGLGRFTEATNEFYEAMRLDPASASPHLYLGIALAAEKDFSGATNEFSAAMRLDPGDPSPLVEWAKALLQQGRDADGVDELQQALQLDPDNFETLAFTAHVLAADEHPGIRNGANALTLAQKANELTGGTQPLVQDVLGMAYAETGQFDAAQSAANNAIQLATAAGMKPETIAGMQKRLQLYQGHQPWRESFLNGGH